MMDPPVSSSTLDAAGGGSVSSNRLAMDPIATSPVSTEGGDFDLTISTPTGSTEILAQHSRSSHRESFSRSYSDQENEGTPRQQQHWIPPPDLSAFKLSRDSIRDQISPTSSVGPSTMPLSTSRRIKSVSSPGGNSVMSASSTPLMKNDNGDIVSPTSPILHLPLPPGSTGSTKRTFGTTPASAPKTTNMTRKAQRYSSLKKRSHTKQGNTAAANTLLNRLFCNNPVGGGNHNMDDDAPAVSTLSVHSGSSAEENTSPRSRKSLRTPTSRQTMAPATCVSVTADFFREASESLTLHDEANVRKSIQTTLQDSFLACSGNRDISCGLSTSPPTYSCAQATMDNNCRVVMSASEDSGMSGPQPVKLVGDAAVGSTTSTRRSSQISPRRKPSPVVIDEDNDIEAPDTKLSMFMSDDDDIAETTSQPPTVITTKFMIPKTLSSDDANHGTPMKQSSSRSMKTPGGLVIPSPFTHSGKGLFPSSAENYYAKSSALPKSPPKERLSAKSSKSSRRKSNSSRRLRRPSASPLGSSTPKEMPTVQEQVVLDPPSPELLPMDKMLDLSATASSSSSIEAPQPPSSPIVVHELITALPPLDSSNETNDVPSPTLESAVKENSTKQNGATRGNVTYFSSSMDSTDNEVNLSNSTATVVVPSTAEPVTDEPTELLESNVEPFRQEVPTATIFELVDRPAVPSIQSKDSIDCTVEELKAKYERKINEQKDQAALANRMARMRLEEISRLESQIDTLKEKQIDEDELLKLRDRLQQTQQEKKKEVERVRKELEARIDEQKKNTKPLSDFERIEQELTAVKKQLEMKQALAGGASDGDNDDLTAIKAKLKAAKQKSPSKFSANSPSHASTELLRLSQELTLVKEESATLKRELEAKAKSTEESLATETGSSVVNEVQRLRRELADTAEKLASANISSAQTDLETELKAVKEELSNVTATLVEKENELQTIHSSSPGSRSDSPARSIRFTSPMTPPKRTIGKSKRLSGGDGKSKHRDDMAEIYDREKESLRQQIALLDKQATESNQEHEKALAELRLASESEISRLKKEMESKLEKHLDKERTIKLTLSEASSREKDDLLEQIDRLHAEKKAERSGGLREVQKKEELLQRISSMESKEKRLLEDHERAIQDLRTVGEQEIQKLRSQMVKQEEDRAIRERELESAISETSSYERDELVQKSEKLQASLQKERDGVVLLKIQIANMEKELEASKREHGLAIKTLKTSTDSEIGRLKSELDERSALEVAMQITSNERDSAMEEIQRLNTKVEQDAAQAAHKLDELRKQHASEVERLTNDTTEKSEIAVREVNERVKEVEQKAGEQLKDLQAKNEEQIAALRSEHVAETEKLQREVRAVEETYKVLITESNAQFESYQNEKSGNIKELQEREQNFKAELSAMEMKLEAKEKEFCERYELLKASQVNHESQMKEADDTHNKQFEDLLSQLDLVEAEHQQTTALKERALSEKDAIVDALGSQLAEAQRKIAEAQKESKQKSDVAEDAQRKCSALEDQCQLLAGEIQELKDYQKKFMKDSAVEREKACEDAREEMIEKAEIQFQQANEHYVKLRKQYDEAQERTKKLDGEVKGLRKKLEKLVNEKESHDIDLKSEIAKLHAANAKIEAESAIKAKDYRRELERLLTTAKDFESKAEEAGKTSRSIQTTLATVVAEKERLQKEYDDMKSVSEELIAIVEGQERHEC